MFFASGWLHFDQFFLALRWSIFKEGQFPSRALEKWSAESRESAHSKLPACSLFS